MKRRLILPLIIMLASPAIRAQYKYEDFKNLLVLKGTWTMNTTKGILNEYWEIQNDSLLIGKSYKVNGKDTLPQETVRLEFKDGKITYNPVVVDQNQQKAVAFKLISLSNNEFIFENKDHDFPHQIIYKIREDGTLWASVKGPTSQGQKVINYQYTRLLKD